MNQELHCEHRHWGEDDLPVGFFWCALCPDDDVFGMDESLEEAFEEGHQAVRYRYPVKVVFE